MRRIRFETVTLISAASIMLCSSSLGWAQARPATSGSTGASPIAIKTWLPNPKALAALNSPAIVGAYTLQPPISFAPAGLPQSMQPPAGVTYAGYTGNYNPDRSRPSLTVMMVPIPAAESNRSLDSIFREMVSGKGREWTKFSQTSPETGKIGTITFERAHFKGTAVSASGPMAAQGMIYVALDHGIMIVMGGEDSQAYAARDLPLIEAAALTFAPRKTTPQ